MKILIDADGCPVVGLTLQLAKASAVACTILCDTSHQFSAADAAVIVCDQGPDSVDYKLVNLLCPGDLVVTQDYGLAAMALSRRAIPVHPNGFRYTDENIGGLLEARAFSGKVRRAGGRLKGQKKRTAQQDQAFAACLQALLEECHAGTGSARSGHPTGENRH